MASLKHSAKDVIAAIEGSGGIKQEIARRLSVHRNTVTRYLNRWPSCQRAYDDEVDCVGDMAESLIIEDMRQGSVETAKWYARSKLKNRGYVERSEQELSGPQGGPMELVIIERVVDGGETGS